VQGRFSHAAEWSRTLRTEVRRHSRAVSVSVRVPRRRWVSVHVRGRLGGRTVLVPGSSARSQGGDRGFDPRPPLLFPHSRAIYEGCVRHPSGIWLWNPNREGRRPHFLPKARAQVGGAREPSRKFRANGVRRGGSVGDSEPPTPWIQPLGPRGRGLESVICSINRPRLRQTFGRLPLGMHRYTRGNAAIRCT
jgi:hypothetical protein